MTKQNPRAGEGARAGVFIVANTSSHSSKPPENPTIIDRFVTIGRSDNGLYLVTVSPPLDGHVPQIFDDYKRARGAASGLRLVYRWPIVDETGGGQ